MGKFSMIWLISLLVVLECHLGSTLSMRIKRQNGDDDLDDRYGNEFGFGRPQNRPWGGFPVQRPRPRPNQFPGQNNFPDQDQFPGQNQFPGQGQFPGQNQIPGQGQFPGQNQFPGQGQFPGQSQTTTRRPGSTTTQASAVQDCIRTCPVTTEYNPVCGTDNMTYSNPGRLTCAQECGVNVGLQRSAPCPATTTAAPAAL